MPSASSEQQAARPKSSTRFDPWHSSSSGHQRGEYLSELAGLTGWRQSRNIKLHQQYVSGNSGGKRMFDTVGAGSKDYGENAEALIPEAVWQRANFNVLDMLTRKKSNALQAEEEKPAALRERESELGVEQKLERHNRIFDGLVIYINGSTHPMISDHKLKYVLVENGARVSMHLGRRDVTHVILGRPSGSQKLGAGGGLAGTKIEKEIKRVRGCSIKYVGVEWVLESLKARKCLTETQFSNLKITTKRQQSVYNAFKKTAAEPSTETNANSEIPRP